MLWAGRYYTPTDPDIVAMVADWPLPDRHSETTHTLARILGFTD